MKCLKIFTFLTCIIICTNSNKANPILELFLSEVQFDSATWKIELQNIYSGLPPLDSCYFTTLTDTAYFKPGITTTDSFIIITQDSLLDSLSINRTGDIIGFHYSHGYPIDQIGFGNITCVNYVSTPLFHQSISLREYDNGDGQAWYWYLDNTPTFGNPNDELNAKGYVTGMITDSLGTPLQNVEIVYDYFYSLGTRYDRSVWTDSTGIFIFRDFARFNTLKIRKENFQTQNIGLQIWPEDTVTIYVTLNPVVDAIETNHSHSLNGYKLSQNYPNPFNSSTSFNYTLPKAEFVEINIYDLEGKLVEKLFDGEQNSGEYKVHWNAESVASGIYIYQIKTNEFINHKKCLLIK